MRVMLVAMVAAVAAIGTGHARAEQGEALTFVADMQGRFVAPAAVETAATARATGVLVGNQFTVHGSFAALSSALRDAVKTPEDPGVHLHQGAAGITTKYFHGLQVRLNADERSGIFFGVATLTDDQKKSLLGSDSYIDIHTVKYGPGEVRDQWRPLNPKAAAKLLAELGAAADPQAGACHSQ